jgi:hypothetical protein
MFVSTFPPVADCTIMATIVLFTTTVAVARVQFDGFAPASQSHIWSMFHLVCLVLLLSFHQYLYLMGHLLLVSHQYCCGSLHSINQHFLLHYPVGG